MLLFKRTLEGLWKFSNNIDCIHTQYSMADEVFNHSGSPPEATLQGDIASSNAPVQSEVSSAVVGTTCHKDTPGSVKEDRDEVCRLSEADHALAKEIDRREHQLQSRYL